MPRPVAFITGASRGIGKASAVALAEAGYDIVATARTMTDGTATGDQSGIAIPGGLDTTITEVEQVGGNGLAVRIDLMDRSTFQPAVDATLERFGRIDLLLNNGVYQGGGSMNPFMDIDEEQLLKLFDGNVFAQMALTRLILPAMIEQGAGTVMNMISPTAYVDPPGKIGDGGWGMGYAMTKAAFERMAPLLRVEHGDDGIRTYNIDPGYVVTEKAKAEAQNRGYDDHFVGATPEVIGKAIAWLATADDADTDEYLGQIVLAQRETKRRHLLPGWPPARK